MGGHRSDMTYASMLRINTCRYTEHCDSMERGPNSKQGHVFLSFMVNKGSRSYYQNVFMGREVLLHHNA